MLVPILFLAVAAADGVRRADFEMNRKVAGFPEGLEGVQAQPAPFSAELKYYGKFRDEQVREITKTEFDAFKRKQQSDAEAAATARREARDREVAQWGEIVDVKSEQDYPRNEYSYYAVYANGNRNPISAHEYNRLHPKFEAARREKSRREMESWGGIVDVEEVQDYPRNEYSYYAVYANGKKVGISAREYSQQLPKFEAARREKTRREMESWGGIVDVESVSDYRGDTDYYAVYGNGKKVDISAQEYSRLQPGFEAKRREQARGREHVRAQTARRVTPDRMLEITDHHEEGYEWTAKYADGSTRRIEEADFDYFKQQGVRAMSRPWNVAQTAW